MTEHRVTAPGFGRDPSGQALAVPATPLRVDGPSGFDPSRLTNGPDLWRAILATMPPGSIVAGGAVRDYLLGYEPKDIDVFMGVPPVSESEISWENLQDLEALPDPRHGLFRIENTHERFEEYAAVSCILCVSSGTLLGHRVDAVEIEHFQGGEELIKEFDFGITRCWFDGQIHDTAEAKIDRANKTVTLLRDERKERSIARFERLKGRWGEPWKLAIATETRQGGDAKQGSVEDEGTGLKGIAHD